jgi:Fe-Mn family superoxide dismutase
MSLVRAFRSSVTQVARQFNRQFNSAAAAATGFAAEPATLPDLAYDYGALEPFISGDIMELHHSKHHQTYVNGFNAGMEQLLDATSKRDAAAVTKLMAPIKFNGGGHLNHSIFWSNLCPKNEFVMPEGDLLTKINEDFGSLDKLQGDLTAMTCGVQGSGWGWLGYDTSKGKLFIKAMPNQDPLAMAGPFVPLLGIDIWEHAYYLQYKNVRPDYVKAIWEIVNWKNVAERFQNAK